MKTISLLTTLLFTYLLSYGYNIEISITGIENSEIILAKYTGDQKIIVDSANIGSDGKGAFTGKNILEDGIYMIATPKNGMFEIMVSGDTNFVISTDTSDLFFKLNITDASNSEIFLNHQKNIIKKQRRGMFLQNTLKQMPQDDKRRDDLQNKLIELRNEISNLNNLFILENKDSFAAKVVKSTMPIDMPHFEITDFSKNPDSLRWVMSLMYYSNHFFDNIDLSDKRMINTPIIHNKIETYFNQVLFQETDSITKAIDKLLANSNTDNVIKSYIIAYLLTNYNKTEKLGHEDVLLHISNNYSLNKTYLEPYIDYQTYNDVVEKITSLNKTTLGKTAPELHLKDITGNDVTLHNTKSNLKVLLFWNPNCEHCKEELRYLSDYYHENMFSGIEVYAVYTNTEYEKWVKYITEHNYNWVNVYDPDNTSNFRDTYYIYYTPKMYLLDSNNKILAKSSKAIEIIEKINVLQK